MGMEKMERSDIPGTGKSRIQLPEDTHWTAEQRLVVQCARTTLKDPDAVRSLLDKGVDWDIVLELADNHATTQLLYKSLKAHSVSVPDDVLKRLRHRSEQTARRNLRFMQELVAIVELFEEQGIPVIPYRGPVLASVAYGDVSNRQFGDLDLLVAQSDIPEVASLLNERGYDTAYWRSGTDGLNSGQKLAYRTFCRDYPFTRDRDNITVEVHWRVVSRHFPSSLTLDTFWDRHESVHIGGHDIPTLSTEDRLLMLCVHGTRHYWERLQWISDIAEFLERHTVDWDLVLERARRQNCLRMFVLGPLIAHELHGTCLPEQIHEIVDADETVRDRRSDLLSYLFVDEQPGGFGIYRYQSSTLDRRRDILRFWLLWAFNPDRPIIESVPLPTPLVPLYYVARPFRLLSMAKDAAVGSRK